MIKLIENQKHSGVILISSSLGKKWIVENTITKIFNDELAKPIYGGTPDCQIKYLAIGTGSDPQSRESTLLTAEVFRTAVTTCAQSDYGQVLSDFTILDTDYTGIITEIGIFGGSTATAVANSGTLLARVLWSYTKSALEELYFQRLDTLT